MGEVSQVRYAQVRPPKWSTLRRGQPGGVHLGEVSQVEYAQVRSARWSTLR